jgi:hypothetical protein
MKTAVLNSNPSPYPAVSYIISMQTFHTSARQRPRQGDRVNPTVLFYPAVYLSMRCITTIIYPIQTHSLPRRILHLFDGELSWI